MYCHSGEMTENISPEIDRSCGLTQLDCSISAMGSGKFAADDGSCHNCAKDGPGNSAWSGSPNMSSSIAGISVFDIGVDILTFCGTDFGYQMISGTWITG